MIINNNRNNKMRSALSVLLSLMLTAGSAAFAYADVAPGPEEGQPEVSLFAAIDEDDADEADADNVDGAADAGDPDDAAGADADSPDPAEGYNGDICLPDEDTEYDGYIVKLTRDSEVGESDQGELVLASDEGDEIPVSDVEEEDIILETEDGEVRLTHVHDDLYTVESLSDVELLDQANLVDYAEPDALMYVMEDPNPVTTYVDDGWGHEFMEAAAYNNMGITGAGIRVGVIDGGFATSNSNLSQIVAADRVEAGRDFTSDDPNAPGRTETVDFNHGLCVSQVIAGDNNPGTEATSGIAPGVTIVPLKVFSDRSAEISTIVPALYAAVDDYHCDVINLSAGGRKGSETLKNACAYVRSKDVLLVVSSGNTGSDSYGAITKQTPMYPAAYTDSCIAVGNVAIDSNNQVSVSNTSVEKNVFISAPGNNLLFIDEDNDLIYNSGTSFSAPAVTAAAALMLQAAGGSHSLTCDELISGLRDRAYRGSQIKNVTYNESNLKANAALGYGVLKVSSLFDTPYYYFRGTGDSHLTLTRSGSEFTLNLSGATAADLENVSMVGWNGANRVVAAATYDSNGKLLTFTNMEETAVNKVQTSTLVPTITADTAQIRCFLLDKTTLAPSSTKMYVTVNITH